MNRAEQRVGPARAAPARAGSWVVEQAFGSGELVVAVGEPEPDVSVATRPGLTCVVQGAIHGLPTEPDGRSGAADTSAERFLRAYLARGTGALDDAKGFFCLVLWDRGSEELLAARDPLGIHPLFYARTARGVLVSPSIHALLAAPGVSGTVNRAALADHLRHLWPDPEETYFEAVRRVQPGHLSTFRRRGTVRSVRYWDPLFPGRAPEWIGPSEVDRFDDLLDASVRRLHAPGRTAIYLSGGLDSVAVGALAADDARRTGAALPLALSLDFPGPFSERPVQAGVSGQLGLPHTFVELDDALGHGGLLRSAMACVDLAAPIQNPWLPAYRSLAQRARAAGCDVVLTGSGGDEWLTVTPVYAADLMRSLQFRQLVRLAHTQYRSYAVSPPLLARNMLWRFGLRPLLVDSRDRALRHLAPDRHRDRQLRNRRDALLRRPWLAPDPALRAELLARDEASHRAHAHDDDLLPTAGPRMYFRECREALTHPLISLEAEEVFEYSRGAGVRVVHPYWDTELVELLHATPPELLNRNGRSKALIREMLGRRFPELGFERQRKNITASYFGWSVMREAPGAWREIGGARALADLGIVDPARSDAVFDVPELDGPPTEGRPVATRQTDPMWHLATVETWLRHHS